MMSKKIKSVLLKQNIKKTKLSIQTFIEQKIADVLNDTNERF